MMIFSPIRFMNPLLRGKGSYHDNQCDAILAVEGGSAIDVTKCIKAL